MTFFERYQHFEKRQELGRTLVGPRFRLSESRSASLGPKGLPPPPPQFPCTAQSAQCSAVLLSVCISKRGKSQSTWSLTPPRTFHPAAAMIYPSPAELLTGTV